MLSRFSHGQLFAAVWTVACQALLSMEFSRQRYWSGLLCPLPGESSRPRDRTQVSCVAGRFSTAEPPGIHNVKQGRLVWMKEVGVETRIQIEIFVDHSILLSHMNFLLELQKTENFRTGQ